MINLLHTKNLCIEKQLSLEKDLLNNSKENFCIINEGSATTIVLGVSNSLDLLNNQNIKIIKRFSGGGAVVVDENTIFITFIFSKKFLDFSFPNEIFKWTYDFYKQSLKIPFFQLKENDYTIKNHKIAGNAQYIKKHRWLHHSSFLWDFSKQHMSFLKIPKIAPKYRKNRDHVDFLKKIKNYFPSKEIFIKKINDYLNNNFDIKNINLKKISFQNKKEEIGNFISK